MLLFRQLSDGRRFVMIRMITMEVLSLGWKVGGIDAEAI